jgi:predicted DNA repair protein MutK
MVRKLAFLLIMLFTAGAFAQDLPPIAVYVTGDDIPAETKDALATFMLDALVNSGLYRTIERSENFLDAINQEHIRQRSGAIDDGQISELGKQAGARFLCVANITGALGSFQVSARIIDIETAEVTASGVSNSPLRTLDDLKQVSAAVVYRMIGVRVRIDQNFELLTEQEQTALEQSIQQTIEQTMQSKQPRRTSFWIALGFDVIGAGLIAYGVYEELNVRDLYNKGLFEDMKEVERRRNVGYIAGAAVLLTGISIHIFF